MLNQRQIAEKLGVSQTTVSRALQGSPAVSKEVRSKVLQAAKQMGYQPNMYANRLVSHIRSGKNLADRDVIALVIEASSLIRWYKVDVYKIFHQGVCRRAKELGLAVECFFLHQPDMSDVKIDRILYARGIRGIILAPPYHGNRSLQFHWDHYAPIAVGFGWEEQDLHRVGFDQLGNYITAFNKLREMGYKRIGSVLTEWIVHNSPYMSKWQTGYLECQNRIPKNERIPLFEGTVVTSEKEGYAQTLEKFRTWVSKWNPDVLLTLVGGERQWLDEIGMKAPQDIGMACLTLLPNSPYAGIDEKGETIGATAVELVAAQLARNEFGLPAQPTTVMIHGFWRDGTSIKQQN